MPELTPLESEIQCCQAEVLQIGCFLLDGKIAEARRHVVETSRKLEALFEAVHYGTIEK